MKKFYLATFAVIATVILAACGGNKQAERRQGDYRCRAIGIFKRYLGDCQERS